MGYSLSLKIRNPTLLMRPDGSKPVRLAERVERGRVLKAPPRKTRKVFVSGAVESARLRVK